MHVEKAILAGHSLAGVELTHFAGTYPARVNKLIYLDALDDRREFPSINEQNPLRNVEIKKEASSPHTFEEYVADFKRDHPSFAEIWSDLWEQEISHNVKVNEEGIFVDKMPASVEKMMIENLGNGYIPKKVEAKIPTLSFYAWRKPKLPDAYTEEQKAAFDQFHREVEEPFSRSLISEFQNRFPHAKIIVIPDGHHYCFIVQEELVHEEMLNFLLEEPPRNNTPPDNALPGNL
jgi:pimeloyl-ACP methyl ester carboxylesterase